MKKDVPPEFLKEYEVRRKNLESALKDATSLLTLRLSQLNARTGARATITESRVKRPARIWAKASKALRREVGTVEVFAKVEDILGIRIVCNNLSDIRVVIDMIRYESSFTIANSKDMIATPTSDGYRAVHVLTTFRYPYDSQGNPIPCEIQIRTLAQDTWAKLSRADLYHRKVPSRIKRLAKTLADQLRALDETAQQIRNELNMPVLTADSIKDSDPISPQRLALLYKETFSEEIYEWTLIRWRQLLDEAEVESIGESRTLLDDIDLRERLDKMAERIRSFPLNADEWVVYSALVASEISMQSGLRAVRKQIKDDWDEITATVRSELLPFNIDGFMEELQTGGSWITQYLSVLDCLKGCARCGTKIPEDTDFIVSAMIDYYKLDRNQGDLEDRLYEAIESWRFQEGYGGDSDFCDWCDYQWEKLARE